MHFQWHGPNTAVWTPVDRLSWLIARGTPLGSRWECVTENGSDPAELLKNKCPVHLQWEYAYLTNDA